MTHWLRNVNCAQSESSLINIMGRISIRESMQVDHIRSSLNIVLAAGSSLESLVLKPTFQLHKLARMLITGRARINQINRLLGTHLLLVFNLHW